VWVLQREGEMLASTCLYSLEYMLVLALCIVVCCDCGLSMA